MPSLSWQFGPGRLGLLQADITTLQADAVVNAANSGLMGGGGVDGAIHRAAGPELLQACKEIVAKQGELPAGQAVITPGFNMPARYVIHTVGPIWRGGNDNEPETLRSAYVQCLALANEHGLKSIAFPAVSCGVYGFPVDLAGPIALTELRQGVEKGLVTHAAMVLYGESAFAQWAGIAATLFGEPDGKSD